MGLFRRARKQRAEAETQTGVERPVPTSVPNPPASVGETTIEETGNGAEPHSGEHVPGSSSILNPTALRDALQELCAQQPTREVFAEQALRIFARTGSTKAAALLGYESRGNRLGLLNSVGLEPAALELLSGENRSQTWDIPLRVLTNKRISVIQGAHENPFVPQAFVAISPRRLAIAVLPFYHAQSPVGVLVLFSATHRGLADGMLQTISNALRTVGAGLTQLPSGSAPQTRAAEDAQQPALLRGLKVLKAQLAQQQQALDEAERQRATEAAERVTAESFLRAERERIAAVEQELGLARAAQELVPALEARIADLSTERAKLATMADQAQAEVERLQSEVTTAEAQALEQANLISALTTAEADLRKQLSDTHRIAEERAGVVAEHETSLGELRVRSAEADKLQKTLRDAEAAKAQADTEIKQLRTALTEAQSVQADAEARASLTEKLAGDVAAQLAETRQQVAQLEVQAAAADELRQQVVALEAVREQLHGTKREHHEAEREWAARSAQLTAERDQLQKEIGRLREQSGSTVADLHERLERVESERTEVRDRLQVLAQADAERETLQHRVEELEQDLAAAHETLRTQEARVRDLSEQSARLIAERRDLHSRIEALTAGGHTLEKEKQQALTTAQRRVSDVEEQITRLTIELDAARKSAAEELAQVRAAAEKELHSVRAKLAEGQRASESLSQDLAQRNDALMAAGQEVSTVVSERNRLREELERFTQQRDVLHQDAANLRAEHAERDERIASLEQALREAQATREATVAEMSEEIAALYGRLDALESERRTEREKLLQSLADKDLLLQAAEEGLGEDVTAAEMEVESMLTIERSGTEVEEEAEPAAEEELAVEGDTGASVEEILVVDAPETAPALGTQVSSYGHPAVGVSPGEGMLANIQGHRFAHATINLSAPSAWQAIRALRSPDARLDVPFLAYSLPAGAASGFWLGPIDFVVLPIAENTLPGVLSRLAPRARRVIGMSNDIDVMSDVRTQLSARGVSTAVVLDGRQALDLVPTVRPEAAILHLSPRCVDVFRAVAGLRSNDASKNIPLMFLLDATPQPQEETFFTAGLRMLATRANLKPADLGNLIASSVDAVAALGALPPTPPAPGPRQGGGMRLAN